VSPLVTSICREHYTKKAPCQGCPIQAACTSGVGVLTEQSLQAWRDRVERAALTSNPPPS